MRPDIIPHVTCTEDSGAGGRLAAQMVLDVLREKTSSVFGLATGRTMMPFYNALKKATHATGLSWQHAVTFNLDEYMDVTPNDEQSFASYMRRHFLSWSDIPQTSFFIPDSSPNSPEAEARRYEELLRQHEPRDIQVLGLGTNGHIGFNEPGSALASETRVIQLAAETIEHNFRGSSGKPDRRAITMGINAILQTKKIVVLAFGVEKRDAVASLLTGPQTSTWPCSFLRTHNNVHLIADRQALGTQSTFS